MEQTKKLALAIQIEIKAYRYGEIRVSDVASWYYLPKRKARNLLDWMVTKGKLKKKKIRYAGNAEMNVYY